METKQASITRDEHVVISNVPGKKVYNIDSSGNVLNFETIKVSQDDTPSIDAFGRARVSNTDNRFDVEFIYDKQPLIIDEVVSGGGTATFNTNSKDVTLAVNNTTNATSSALYAHYDVPYTAGNSQLIDITGSLNAANIAGGTAFVFLRTKVTGTVAETTYAQTAWNKNTAADVDWQFSQIFQIDFQSLKVGRIRFNLVRNGLPVTVHEIYNDNIRTGGYWQRPTLPPYWRIYNDATYTYMEIGYGDEENAIGFKYRIPVNASATLRAVCGTVKSEGGKGLLELNGYPFGISNRTTAKTVSTTLVPVLSIRTATGFASVANRGLALIKGYGLSIDNPVNYRLLYRASLVSALWQQVDPYSFIEYDVSAPTVTGGVLIEDDVAQTSRNVPATKDNSLGRTILSAGRSGEPDVLTLAAVRTTTSNSNTYVSFHWEEIR